MLTENPFWPGENRAGTVFAPESFLIAMTMVEEQWLTVLGHEPPVDLVELLDPRFDLDLETGGNPVIPLVQLFRELLSDRPEAARWLHRGLTSQDVLDSALMLLLKQTAADAYEGLGLLAGTLADLAEAHRDTPMVARTLTQHAVPTTFGLKVTTWLSGVMDARLDLEQPSFPVQLGGAGGTRAAIAELGLNPSEAAAELATRLGLEVAAPWHTSRRPVTRVADALISCTDACGRIANDVLTLSRPEIGELSEAAGGGSSTMPGKSNPILSVLVRRAALSTPQLAATLHVAAADQGDERADGAWHVEWDTLRILARRTVSAVSQTYSMVRDLEVHADRMRTTLNLARETVHAEQRSMAELVGHEVAGNYLGQAGELVDKAVHLAREVLA